MLREDLNLRLSKSRELSKEGLVGKGDQGEWSCVLEKDPNKDWFEGGVQASW